MVKVQAIEMRQKGVGQGQESVIIYVTVLKFGVLREIVAVEQWSINNPNGYQGELPKSRLRDISTYVLFGKGICPTSLLFTIRTKENIFIPASNLPADEDVRCGELTIPDGTKLSIIDGMVRFYGIKKAWELGAQHLDQYLFPVAIMYDISYQDEKEYFSIINTYQKKMRTDIVDKQLSQVKPGYMKIASGQRSYKQDNHAISMEIVGQLNQIDGPWYHRIALPGEAGEISSLVVQRTMAASLAPILKESVVEAKRINKVSFVVNLLNNYWLALKDEWPNAFTKPAEYRLQTTIGIFAMHIVLGKLLNRNQRDLRKETIADQFRRANIDIAFWAKSDDVAVQGKELTFGTGMKTFTALAKFIIDKVPETEAKFTETEAKFTKKRGYK